MKLSVYSMEIRLATSSFKETYPRLKNFRSAVYTHLPLTKALAFLKPLHPSTISSFQPHTSSLAPHTQPREAAPVYRCHDSHWHFIPSKNDHHLGHLPWYRQIESPDQGKYPSGTQRIYVKGCGSEPFTVDRKYISGFYSLYHYRGQEEWCTGRYGRYERKLWREEELSLTMWVGRNQKLPPAYESSSSSSSSRRLGY